MAPELAAVNVVPVLLATVAPAVNPVIIGEVSVLPVSVCAVFVSMSVVSVEPEPAPSIINRPDVESTRMGAEVAVAKPRWADARSIERIPDISNPLAGMGRDAPPHPCGR